jgi:20S proteasome alpha/beta subunit
VVIATEKVPKSILVDEHSVHRVEEVTKHIGMVYSGESQKPRAKKADFFTK